MTIKRPNAAIESKHQLVGHKYLPDHPISNTRANKISTKYSFYHNHSEEHLRIRGKHKL